jgi:DNA-binding CsgD family transcriptional regulator
LQSDNGKFNQACYDQRNLFNLGHPLFLFERYIGYFDLFLFFSTTNNESIINFYINNIDVLEKFGQFFKEKAAKLIIAANAQKIIIPTDMRPNFKGLTDPITLAQLDKQKFLGQLNVKRYQLSGKYQHVSLTARELECIKCLATGYTAKETANFLRLSIRTIETYISNIKVKLDCHRKSQIIKIITEQ